MPGLSNLASKFFYNMRKAKGAIADLWRWADNGGTQKWADGGSGAWADNGG